jgi:hypothetical protein
VAMRRGRNDKRHDTGTNDCRISALNHTLRSMMRLLWSMCTRESTWPHLSAAGHLPPASPPPRR